LNLHEQLAAGAELHLGHAQAALKKMLYSLPAGQGREPASQESEGNEGTPENEADSAFTIRYVMTCWLDELFIRYSPWSRSWSENKLEGALYGSDDGHWKFWRLAQEALERGQDEALALVHLCVLLGFRGERHACPEKVRDWIHAARTRLASSSPRFWQPPPELEPVTHVPALHGQERLQRMAWICGLAVSVLVPVVVYFLARGTG
jgi:type VI protein secretion system component VasF